MVLKFFLIFITALTIFAAESRSSDAEDLYIKSRNEFLKKYSRKNLDARVEKEETAALAQLEKLLTQAIGPIKFSSEFGEINLALSPYDDGTHIYGNVDGICGINWAKACASTSSVFKLRELTPMMSGEISNALSNSNGVCTSINARIPSSFDK